MDIQLRKEIGRGAQGKVCKAIKRQSREEIAVKVMPLGAGWDDHIKREVKVMRQLKHKYILPLIDVMRKQSDIWVVMPLRQGSLRQLGTLSATHHESLLYTILYQMLSALEYLANQNLCHRDVKPENILYYRQDKRYTFQLADFGLANTVMQAKTFCGTPVYWAPELLRGQRQTPAVDVWSLFVTIASVMGFIDVNKLFHQSPEITTKAIIAVTSKLPHLERMAILDYTKRATAAQMLQKMKTDYPYPSGKPAAMQKPLPGPVVEKQPMPQQAPTPGLDLNANAIRNFNGDHGLEIRKWLGNPSPLEFYLPRARGGPA